MAIRTVGALSAPGRVGLLATLLLYFLRGSALALGWYTNPQLVQGASATFSATGNSAPSFGPGWQVVNSSGTDVGSSQSARGWKVTYSVSSLTVTAPSTAPVGTNYLAKYFNTSQQPISPHSALFDVVSGASTNPPDTPGNIVGSVGSGSVTLTWAASANATSYTVQRAYFSGGVYTTLSSTITGTTYTDTGLTNNLTYYYEISASNVYGTSAFSAELPQAPRNTGIHFELSGVTETRAHAVVVNLNVIGASSSSGSSDQTVNGVNYHTQWSINYFFGTDIARQATIVVPQGASVGNISATSGTTSVTASCIQVTSNPMAVQIASSSSAGRLEWHSLECCSATRPTTRTATSFPRHRKLIPLSSLKTTTSSSRARWRRASTPARLTASQI